MPSSSAVSDGSPSSAQVESHSAVEAFWEQFHARAAEAEAQASPETEGTTDEPAQSMQVSEELSKAEPSDDDAENDGSKESALHAALNAAKSEVADPNASASKRAAKGSKKKGRSTGKTAKGGSKKAVSTYAADLMGGGDLTDEARPAKPEREAIPEDLDPEVAMKLKLLRRLNPGKSMAELLAQIDAPKTKRASGASKKKRGWFS